jgi:hypothetical protein
MTRTTRLRRTILHLRQIFFTEAMTFIVLSPSLSYRAGRPPLKFAFLSRLSYWCVIT